MAVLIDASVLIEHERGRISLADHLAGRESEDFHLSVVTASELLHGVHRASTRELRSRRSAWVEAILDRFPMVPIDVGVARAHAQIWADLAVAGRLIGPNDLWLAATCIAHGFALVTANVREFERVPGLKLENWLTRS